ncbi:MAG: CDP-alcohol phosphatidyltransferase family protein [Candidatus Limimorpha sp.]
MMKSFVKLVKRNMANIITAQRIVLSAPLLMSEPLSPSFYIIYSLCGLSDIADGFVARRTNAVSRFGERLDSAADIVFVAVCLCKLLPVIGLEKWLYAWVAAIALIKVVNVIIGYVRAHSFVPVHSMLNRLTGLILFLFPFFIGIVEITPAAAIVCVFASVAAIQEGVVIIKANSVD